MSQLSLGFSVPLVMRARAAGDYRGLAETGSLDSLFSFFLCEARDAVEGIVLID